jgi:hypothetical protein
MSTDPAAHAASEPAAAASEPTPADHDARAGAQREQPSEEELRVAYEAEISRITSTDMILQAVVSLLNIGGHRLGLAPAGAAGGTPGAQESSRDLEQVRDAIDGVRALMPILERREPENLRPLRDALSQLQMAYAREAGAGAPAADRAPAAAKPEAPAVGEKSAGPGPAQSSGRLWVPGR